MRAVARLAAVLVWTVLLLPSVAFAQASIAGVVRDTSGAVLPGVTVEAASPVLIEKVRTAVTDGNGRYQLVDLRPGTYSVTVSLAGFNTVKRDGVALTGSGIVAVDVELRVGALEETITVTGEAPVVDTQSLTTQRVLNAEVDRRAAERPQLLRPGAHGARHARRRQRRRRIADPGRRPEPHRARQPQRRSAHHHQRRQHDDLAGRRQHRRPDAGHGLGRGSHGRYVVARRRPADRRRARELRAQGRRQHVQQLRHLLVHERVAAGRQLFRPSCSAQGLGTPNKILHAVDLNESFGGPLKRDKVWFWASFRINDVANSAPVFVNKNAFNPERVALRSRYQPAGREPGRAAQHQRPTHLAGQRQEQDRRHLQGRQVVQLPEPDERHHRARGGARPPVPAASPGARASGPRRSPTSS